MTLFFSYLLSRILEQTRNDIQIVINTKLNYIWRTRLSTILISIFSVKKIYEFVVYYFIKHNQHFLGSFFLCALRITFEQLNKKKKKETNFVQMKLYQIPKKKKVGELMVAVLE